MKSVTKTTIQTRTPTSEKNGVAFSDTKLSEKPGEKKTDVSKSSKPLLSKSSLELAKTVEMGSRISNNIQSSPTAKITQELGKSADRIQVGINSQQKTNKDSVHVPLNKNQITPPTSGFALDSVITRNPNKYTQQSSLFQRVKRFVFGIPLVILRTPAFLKTLFFVWLISIVSFTFLLFLYLLDKFFSWIFLFPLIPKDIRVSARLKLSNFFILISSGSRQEERTINRMNLIDLAIRNMLFKKSRAIITVGGMAIGIAAIVFLVSIGFGLQQLVLSRVARLDELSQAEASPLPGSKEKINDATISKIKDIDSVTQVLPIISSVAKVTFNNSQSDMAVYGVTSDFLNQSAIKPVRGKIFESNELVNLEKHGEVAGIFDEIVLTEPETATA